MCHPNSDGIILSYIGKVKEYKEEKNITKALKDAKNHIMIEGKDIEANNVNIAKEY